MSFVRKQDEFTWPSIWDLGVTYTLQIELIGNPLVDFLYSRQLNFFVTSYGWFTTSEKSAEGDVFWTDLFERNFRWKETSPPNHCRCQKTRWIYFPFVWYGIKISPVGKHARCDRRTYRRTDGQNFDSLDRACIVHTHRAVKSHKLHNKY